MPVILARLFYIVIGASLFVGCLAYVKTGTDRGYFEGKSGDRHRKGEATYGTHLFLAGLGVCGGAALAVAGVVLPDDHPLLNKGYGR